MALTTNQIRTTVNPNLTLVRQLTVATGQVIYKGALVSIDGSGNAVIATAGSKLGGVANNYAIATENVTLDFNQVEQFSFATTIDKVGNAIYATSDNVLTLSAQTCIVGYIVELVDAATVLVHVTTRV